MRNAVLSNHQDLRSLAESDGVPYHYLPIIAGRRSDQEKRLIEQFDKMDAEHLVLARCMQILKIDAYRYILNRAINGMRSTGYLGTATKSWS